MTISEKETGKLFRIEIITTRPVSQNNILLVGPTLYLQKNAPTLKRYRSKL